MSTTLFSTNSRQVFFGQSLGRTSIAMKSSKTEVCMEKRQNVTLTCMIQYLSIQYHSDLILSVSPTTAQCDAWYPVLYKYSYLLTYLLNNALFGLHPSNITLKARYDLNCVKSAVAITANIIRGYLTYLTFNILNILIRGSTNALLQSVQFQCSTRQSVLYKLQ